MVVLSVRLNINLSAEPLEKVVARAQRAIESHYVEIENTLRRAGCPQIALEPLRVGRNEVLEEEPNWFNQPHNYGLATSRELASLESSIELLRLEETWDADELTRASAPAALARRLRSVAEVCENMGDYKTAARVAHLTLPASLRGGIRRRRGCADARERHVQAGDDALALRHRRPR